MPTLFLVSLGKHLVWSYKLQTQKEKLDFFPLTEEEWQNSRNVQTHQEAQ